MVKLYVEKVIATQRHNGRSFIKMDGSAAHATDGGELELTITCRVNVSDAARIDAIKEIIGDEMTVDLEAARPFEPPRQDFFEGKTPNYSPKSNYLNAPNRDVPEASEGQVTW